MILTSMDVTGLVDTNARPTGRAQGGMKHYGAGVNPVIRVTGIVPLD